MGDCSARAGVDGEVGGQARLEQRVPEARDHDRIVGAEGGRGKVRDEAVRCGGRVHLGAQARVAGDPAGHENAREARLEGSRDGLGDERVDDGFLK